MFPVVGWMSSCGLPVRSVTRELGIDQCLVDRINVPEIVFWVATTMRNGFAGVVGGGVDGFLGDAASIGVVDVAPPEVFVVGGDKTDGLFIGGVEEFVHQGFAG